MKLSKKKVFALALVVCLIATLSLGSLAWFTDYDSETNDFMVAGSDNEDPDEIFSVEVWEEGDDEDDGLDYENILPGDTWGKIAHVKNTGSYEQYIRVEITVSDAKIWQAAYMANLVPVTEFVNVDKVAAWGDVYGIHSALDEDGNNFVYYLYYKTPIAPDNKETQEDEAGDITVFTEAYVCEHLTREQAADFKKDGVAGYQISVRADAVQTKYVGENVYEAFKTVGMEIPVNTAYVSDRNQVVDGFANSQYIVLTDNITNMYAAHKINGTSAELYLNGYMLETASGEWQGVHGVTMTGELAISGYGSLKFGTLGASVGSLTIHGGTVTARRTDLLLENGNPIVLP